MLLNCGVEKTLESPLDCKAIKTVNRKGNQPWVFTGRTDAKADISILWPPDAKNWLIGKDLDAGKDWLNTGGEGDDRGWDVWMASPIQWKWAWASSRSWWWTGKPGVLNSTGSRRVGYDSVTELNWMLKIFIYPILILKEKGQNKISYSRQTQDLQFDLHNIWISIVSKQNLVHSACIKDIFTVKNFKHSTVKTNLPFINFHHFQHYWCTLTKYIWLKNFFFLIGG